MSRKQNLEKKKKRKMKWFVLILILVIIGISSYMAIKHAYGAVYTDRPEIVSGSELDKIKKEHEENIYSPDEDVSKRPYSVLLVGLDSGQMDSGRSDTLMVALVDPKNHKASLLSIPRDTRVQIAGGDLDKINHAHNDGINTTIMTVEDFLDIKIDFYAQINFDGFQDLVNTIGGVTVDVEKDMTFADRITRTTFSLNAGEQHLNGIQALNYARFRGDGEGDFGRNRRQQQVVKALIDESINFRNVTKINQLIDDVGENVETDMNFSTLTKTLAKMKSVSSEDIYSIPMKAYPASYYGVSYVEADEDSLETVKTYIKDVLDEKDPGEIQVQEGN